MHRCISATDSNTSIGMIWVTLNMPSAMEECREPSWNFTLSGEWSPWLWLRLGSVPFAMADWNRTLSEDNDKIIVRSVNLALWLLQKCRSSYYNIIWTGRIADISHNAASLSEVYKCWMCRNTRMSRVAWWRGSAGGWSHGRKTA